MSDTAKEIQETFVDIKQTYVDEKLREFFSVEGKEVNIDNICLFAAKTIEEYNLKVERKLKGKQKLEAAVELAKSVIERSVAFVPEDVRRQIVKNIYHNIDTIEQTIQFIMDISNNPNIVNFGKWVENTKRAVKNVVTGENEEKTEEGKPKRGFFKRCLGCICPPPNPEEAREKEMVVMDETTEPKPATTEEVAVEEKVEESSPEKAAPKLSKKELKKQAEAEKLRKKLEELSMTPEEKEARKKAEEDAKKAAEEEAKKKIEEEKKAKADAEAEKIAKKKAEEDAKIKAKADAEAEKLRKKLEELNMTEEEKEAKKKAEKDEKVAKKKAEEEAKKKAKADAEAEKLRKKLEELEGTKKEEVKAEEVNEQKEN